MKIQQPYSIRKVQADERDQIVEFMMRVRKEIFPMLTQDELPPDLLYFNKYYMEQNDAAIFAAFFEDGTVIGTIAITPYDGRFVQLDRFYHHSKTAEIVKCYVDRNYRRFGLGSILFDEALQFCKQAGYETLYLHTHPFLPGAIPFWKSKGFEERLAEDDPIWNTLHMDVQVEQHHG